MSSLPASMRKTRSKMKSLSIGQHFSHYKSMGAYFSSLKGNYSKANTPVWHNIELRCEFMPVLVACKFAEDPIKIEGTIDRTRSNMGFLALKGR